MHTVGFLQLFFLFYEMLGVFNNSILDPVLGLIIFHIPDVFPDCSGTFWYFAKFYKILDKYQLTT